MSPHDTPTMGVEQRGLLRSTSFDVDDADSVERYKKHSNRSDEEWFGRRRWKIGPTWLRPRNILVGIAVCVGIVVVGAFWFRQPVDKPDLSSPVESSPAKSVLKESSPATSMPLKIPPATFTSTELASIETPDAKKPDTNIRKFEKPKDFKIIGLVFFGRPSVVEILDCYLKKNLVSNGGFLDEVLWAINTRNEEDIKYLERLVKTTDGYKTITIPNAPSYKDVWTKAVERNHMYIKIDDDMVYMSENAIPNVVYSKLNHPESLNVVANLVNSPETGWLHYHVGAVHAYLPETEPPASDTDDASYGPKAWRASALPEWTGKEMGFPVVDKPDDGRVLEDGQEGAPPSKNHRWLPLGNDTNIDKTPIGNSRYDPYGPDWKSWALAAQVHYSLLENIEKNQLERYYYGSSLDDSQEGIWNMNYDRMNINFMAIWGNDVVEHSPFKEDDDEAYLSQTLTKELRRPLLVNTHAIAAHFSFRTQHEVYDTDLLSRYRAYANEMICTKDNQIKIHDRR